MFSKLILTICLPLFLPLVSQASTQTQTKSSAHVVQVRTCLSDGETGYVRGSPSFPNKPCCENLTQRDTAKDCNKKCKVACGGLIEGQITEFVCVACGDKKCDRRFESHCNCPEDCP